MGSVARAGWVSIVAASLAALSVSAKLVSSSASMPRSIPPICAPG